jgi:pathogenesis-related protein 1
MTAGANPLSQTQIDAFVTAHNQARSGPLTPTPSPALPPVTWDPILADTAYNYASRCPGSGDLIPHNANRTADYRALGGTESYVGENIYGTTSTSTAGVPADAVDLWMDEAPLYDYAANNIGDAGHYTQVVWRSSVRIGCAIFDCPNVRFRNTALCNYAPGGNITNQKPY